MRTKSILKVATVTLGLVLGLVTVPPAASAAENVTQTITVKGVGGAPYVGAQVAIGYSSKSEGLNRTLFTATTTTNASGIATISHINDIVYGFVSVQPPASDTTTASAMRWDVVTNTNSSAEIVLSTSSIRLEVVKPDNSPGDLHTLISTANYAQLSTLRSGPSGLNLTFDPVTDKVCMELKAENLTSENNLFFKDYFTKLVDGTWHVYFDDGCTNENEILPVNGVIKLKQIYGNISGTLTNTDRTTLALNNLEGYEAVVSRVVDSGATDISKPGARGFVRSNGDFFVYIDTATAAADPGRYEIVFNSTGSLSKPSFVGGSFWITASGKFSKSRDFASPTETYSESFALPAPNLKIKLISPSTGLPATGVISLSYPKTKNSELAIQSRTTVGSASFKITNSVYVLDVNYFPNLAGDTTAASAPMQFFIKVSPDGSAVTALFPLNGGTAKLVGGVWELQGRQNNFQVQISNSTGSGITGYFEFCKLDINGNNQSCDGRGVDQDGKGGGFLEDGNWRVTVHPDNQNPNLVSKDYSVKVEGGVISVTGALKVGDYWILKAGTPNISGSLKDVNGNLTFTGDQGINLQVQKYVVNHWEWQNGGSFKQSANWGVNVTRQGRYRMVAVPYGYSDLAQTYSPEFWVDGSGKVSDTATAGSYTDTLTLDISMKAPNLRFKVLNPIDGTLLPSGWIEIHKVLPLDANATKGGGGTEWISNADLGGSTPGLTSTYLSEIGEYILRVNPPQGSDAIVGLAMKEYRATVSALDSVTVTSDGVPVTKEGNKFIVSPDKANLTLKAVYANGNAFGGTGGKWLNVYLQKWQDQNKFWVWGASASASQDGYVSFSAHAPGKYRLRLEPQGDPEVTATYSEEFTITEANASTFEKNFGNIVLVGPSIKVSVKKAGVADNLTFTNIEIRKNGQWIDWANTLNNGVAAISLPSEGEYEFVVYPNADATATASRKIYAVTATKSVEGVITAVVKPATGVSVADNITTLMLGSPTISGTVQKPGETTTVQNAQVVALDTATNKEMWEYSSITNQSGQWAMSLPRGTYKIMARAPYGVADYGNSVYSGEVAVGETGTATSLPDGLTANAFEIHLKAPTWSGVVKNPAGSAVVPYARVCLRLNQKWNCTNANISGAWALSAPAEYTSFDSGITDAYLESADDNGGQYTMYRADGITAVKEILTNGGSGIEIRLTSPNTRITITAGGAPAANVWVSAERDNVGWLGGASTNSEGVASLNIANPSTAFRIRAEVGKDPLVAANYSTTQKTFSASDIETSTVGGVFIKTIPLDTPNFRVIVREPRSDGSVGPIVTGTWVDMFNESTGEWLGGSGTNSNGVAGFKVAAATGCYDLLYTLNVNPPWNTSTNYSRQSYKLLIKCNGEMTLSNKITDAVVTKESIAGVDAYSVTLGLPSITGVVVNPLNVPVSNSWVVPVNTTTYEWMWQIGSNSRSDGTFGISAPSGDYRIEANVPWGLSDVAKPAPCSVNVTNGAVTTAAGGCVQENKSIVLSLRAPNVTFTLKSGGVAVANANVSLAAGKWYVNAQSNKDGKVSFFIDADEIRTLNGTSSSIPLNIWVDPPYGSSTMARWDCLAGDTSKPICASLVAIPASGSYPTKLLGDITGVQPNTKIRVIYPDTTAAIGAWVNVFTIKPSDGSYGKRWLAAGGSDSEGYVAFNIDTSTVTTGATYVVEVNSPWNKRALFSTKEYTNANAGYTWSEINNGSFALATPNLKVTVYAPNGIDRSKWGWIGIQEVDVATGNYGNWVGGFGLDDSAATSVTLAASKRYRIFANPGPGRPGAQTDCIVQTDASESVTVVSGGCPTGTFSGSDILRITLNGGNVVGRVLRLSDDSNVAGAIVFANPVGAPDESGAVISCTSDEGLFGLTLDKTKAWDIKIFPVTKGTETVLASQSILNVRPLTSGTKTLDTIKLANK